VYASISSLTTTTTSYYYTCNMDSSLVTVLMYGVLWLWSARCESLTGSPEFPEIFYSFGSDVGDRVVSTGDDNCDGPITIPLNVFGSNKLFVSDY